jgi:hypothetical protein
MFGLLIVVLFFILSFLIERTMKVRPTIHFQDKLEYIPILTANIYADLFIIFITFSRLYYSSSSLEGWYKKYRLSAMVADILIGVLYMLLGRYVVYAFGLQVGLTAYAALCVAIQVVFDFLFYLFFSAVPLGSNHMLDFFKKYARESGVKAILGDSFLMILSCLASANFATLSLNANIVLFIVNLYFIPFLIYSF